MTSTSAADAEVQVVASALRLLDPDGSRTAQVVRDTLDQLYDGQRTGRYRWDQLFKTEKTHCGTLVEINLQRAFEFQDGSALDYRIAGIDVDCKFSQTIGGWMIPPEAIGHLCLLLWANDESAKWSMGLVRATAEHLNTGGNRDKKATLNETGRKAIAWIFNNAALPPNVLLQLSEETVKKIMSSRFGTQRVNELFRNTLGMRVGRAIVATVDRGLDYMKRVRGNGGARTALQPEGIVILGQFNSHVAIAHGLGIPVPGRGESVSVRLAPADSRAPGVVTIGGRLWRVAKQNDPVVPAPLLPEI